MSLMSNGDVSVKNRDAGVIDIQMVLKAMHVDGITNREGEKDKTRIIVQTWSTSNILSSSGLHMVVLLLSLSAVCGITEKPNHSFVPWYPSVGLRDL